MEENFRNVLIILSAVVITAIFIHGLWTIRKQKNPYKLKASKDKVEPITRDFDRKGFDQDGVGKVKVSPNTQSSELDIKDKAFADELLSNSDQLADDLSKSQVVIKNNVLGDIVGRTAAEKSEPIENKTVEKLDDSIEDDWFKEEPQLSSGKQFTEDELGDELISTPQSEQQPVETKPVETKAAIISEPLYEQPVTQAKPARTPINKVNKPPSKAALKRNQMEIDFDSQLGEETTEPATKTAKTQLEPQVIILSVVMPANQQMFGAALLPSLLTLGLKYGEMNIFHRHEDNAGNGKVTFSLANIMNPGSFDLDSMENFATRGVSLFMTLPNAGDAFNVFEQMLNAAKQLAKEFNAQVIDDKRNVMTKQTEQHYLSKIREFDRKSRIALVE